MLFVHRYTIVMIYYAFSLVLMMLFRPFISYKFVDGRGYKSIYAALYFLPVLIITQAVFGGLICEYAEGHTSQGDAGVVIFMKQFYCAVQCNPRLKTTVSDTFLSYLHINDHLTLLLRDLWF